MRPIYEGLVDEIELSKEKKYGADLAIYDGAGEQAEVAQSYDCLSRCPDSIEAS
jgi:hypothetical protein